VAGPPPSRQSALRREHVVAASLVGTVVVLVGFASGLGITHAPTAQTTATGPAQGTSSALPAPNTDAGGTGADGGGSGGGGANYVGVGYPGGSGDGYPGDGFVGSPPFPSTTTTTAASAPGGGTPTTTPDAPVPTCQAGLVPALASTAVNEAGTVVAVLPVLGPLLGAAAPGLPSVPAPTTSSADGVAGIVNGLTGTLLGSCPSPANPTPTPTVTMTTTPVSGP
jgi:hypothetical protein